MSQHDEFRIFPPLAFLIFGAVCISFAPVFVKLIGAGRMGPSQIGFWRTMFGAIFLFGALFVQGKLPKLTSLQYITSAIAGFIFFVDLFVWHRSINFAGAGMATILGNTQVFGTAILSYLIFKERLTVRFFISAVAAIFGVILLVGFLSSEVEFGENYIKGIIFGLLTGLAYASFLNTLKWTSCKEPIKDVIGFMAWTSLFSAVAFGVNCILEEGTFLPPDTESWLILVTLGGVAQAMGWWVITKALGHIEVSRAGLVLLLQPTLAMVWGVMFFAEHLSSLQVFGAVITLVAIYYGGLTAGKRK